MTCENAWEWISAALDGELTADEQAQLDLHLAQCSHCRALFDDLSAIHGACTHLEVTPPPALRAQILDHLPPQRQPAKVISIHWRRWAAMAAAFVFVAMAAWHLPEALNKPTSPTPVAVQDAPTTDSEPTANGTEPAVAPSERPTDVAPIDAASVPDETAEFVPLSDEAEAAAEITAAIGGTNDSVAEVPSATPQAAARKVAQAPLNAENGAVTENALPNSTDGASEGTAPLLFSSARSMITEVPVGYGGSTRNMADRDSLEDSSPSASAGGTVDSGGLSIQNTINDLAELPEPHPEMAEEELVAAAFLKTECWQPSKEYCGALTFEGSAALMDHQPDQEGEDGSVYYYLPKAAFDALVKELEAGGIPFDLRTTGDDISATAETGCVCILSPK